MSLENVTNVTEPDDQSANAEAEIDWEKVVDILDMPAVESAAEGADYVGFCVACGAEHSEIEPDVENSECEICEAKAVFGAEQILLYTMA